MGIEVYRKGLSDWVIAERLRLGEYGKPLSYKRFATRIAIETGKEFDAETIRGWETKRGSQQRISDDAEQAIAAYCRKAGLPAPEWLVARTIGEGSEVLPLLDYIRQSSVADAPKIAEIAAEAIRWLIAHGFGPKIQPPSIEAFRRELQVHQAMIATHAEIPLERINAIAQGDWPNHEETLALATYWGPDTSWLIDLIKAAKAGSVPAPTTDRPAKSKSNRPPSGRA
jgi:hypothetical protein